MFHPRRTVYSQFETINRRSTGYRVTRKRRGRCGGIKENRIGQFYRDKSAARATDRCFFWWTPDPDRSCHIKRALHVVTAYGYIAIARPESGWFWWSRGGHWKEANSKGKGDDKAPRVYRVVSRCTSPHGPPRHAAEVVFNDNAAQRTDSVRSIVRESMPRHFLRTAFDSTATIAYLNDTSPGFLSFAEEDENIY